MGNEITGDLSAFTSNGNDWEGNRPDINFGRENDPQISWLENQIRKTFGESNLSIEQQQRLMAMIGTLHERKLAQNPLTRVALLLHHGARLIDPTEEGNYFDKLGAWAEKMLKNIKLP